MPTCGECGKSIDTTNPVEEWFSHSFACSKSSTEYVLLSEASAGLQTQYTSLYTGVENHRYGGHRANLGADLRFYGSPAKYHTMMIHRDDAPVFEERLREVYNR